ncbi:MAG: serine protein kinase RIO, partial [Candidatus Diapherotrites archaeon]|nr:serine protein kinase RIO [Candidatus Diapherotrites archaeon]
MKIDQYHELVSRLMAGVRDADTRKAYQEVFDADTVATIYKLMEAGYIKELGNVISTGKEANVFFGIDRNNSPIAIKIYRINTTEFRHMWKYIEGDPRVKITKRNRRHLIYQWARREFKNLETAYKNGVRVPFPIVNRKNVLIMEYIGDESGPAPLLREYEPEDVDGFTEELLDSLARLYYKAEIIHADLSEYNILVWEERPVIIDMGQSMTWDHPFAYEFFYRDMNQLLKILNRLGKDY